VLPDSPTPLRYAQNDKRLKALYPKADHTAVPLGRAIGQLQPLETHRGLAGERVRKLAKVEA